MIAGLSCRPVGTLLLAMIASCIFAQGSAQAATRIAVHVPTVESDGKVTEGRRNKFHDMLVTGLKEAASADATVITGEEVRFTLGDKPSLLDCKDGPCLQKVAEQLKVDRLIVARISIKAVVGGNSYRIALSVYDANGTATPVSGNESCGDESEGCNLNRAFAALKRSTASIAGQVSAPAKPEPPPVATPTTPLTTSPTSGTSAPGEVPALKDPTVGTTRPYNRGYRIGWITAAAVTGAFVIASIPFLSFAARENQITCAPGTPRDQCPTVYTGNLGPGLGLLVGGGVAGATAFGVLFYLDRKEQRRVAGK